MFTDSESEYQDTNISIVTGCQHARESLSCLRSSSAGVQKANMDLVYPNRGGPPLYTWLPVINGEMVVDFI